MTRENMFATVTLTCKNGYSWKACINNDSSDESIKEYFVGKHFNTESFPKETMSECVTAEIVRPVKELTHAENWKRVFDLYRSSNKIIQTAIRDIASKQLEIDFEGSGQGIGSSDINHTIYSLIEDCKTDTDLIYFALNNG
jgi:hypothetical protein